MLAAFANRPVCLKVYADRVVFVANRIIALHDRVIERGHHRPGYTVYDWRHYMSVLRCKPVALRKGAPPLQSCLLNSNLIRVRCSTGLKLVLEPTANTRRYDDLLEFHHPEVTS